MADPSSKKKSRIIVSSAVAGGHFHPASRTQVMNYAQNVIYDEMQLACTKAKLARM